MKLAIACSLLICLIVSVDTAQAQKYIDLEATMDRVRETEPELWRQHDIYLDLYVRIPPRFEVV